MTTPLPAAAEIPLHLGSDDDFARVRAFFAAAAFDDATLCPALRVRDLSELERVKWEEIDLAAWPAARAWCLQVFVRGQAADEAAARAACGDEVLAAMHRLGLLRAAKRRPAALVSPVWVYPVAGFVVASDRREDPDGGEFVPPEDVVFPAIYPGTVRFLQLLPTARGGEALDLCGGSGIGALQLARAARRADTADLTPRSAFFAEFNARLNGSPVRSLCGDLYAPAGGSRYDLITAHPPFVPATSTNMVYRDGGDTGEEVTRRVIEGLPQYLRPGGTALILCVARDTQEKTFEQRAAEWLGAGAAEFDLVFGLEKTLGVEEVVDSMRKRGRTISDDEARQLFARLRALGTKQFVYGALFLRRDAAEAGPLAPVAAPLRVRLTLDGRAADFERLLAWRRQRRAPEFAAWLRAARPRLAPTLELSVRHVLREGALVPAEFTFTVAEGFEAALRPEGWIVPLIARLHGAQSVAEIFEAARAADELPAGFPLEAFADLVGKMIERDFLRVDPPGGV
jgi:methylase of polypeptide subunit release factors